MIYKNGGRKCHWFTYFMYFIFPDFIIFQKCKKRVHTQFWWRRLVKTAKQKFAGENLFFMNNKTVEQTSIFTRTGAKNHFLVIQYLHQPLIHLIKINNKIKPLKVSWTFHYISLEVVCFLHLYIKSGYRIILSFFVLKTCFEMWGFFIKL